MLLLATLGAVVAYLWVTESNCSPPSPTKGLDGTGAPEAEPVERQIPALPADAVRHVELLQDASSRVGARRRALKRLRAIGPDAASTAPVVCEYLADPDLATEAAATLAALGSGAMEPVRRSLQSEDPMVRGSAAFALFLMGEAAASARADILGLIDDPDPRVSGHAMSVLRNLAPLSMDEARAVVRVYERSAVRPALRSAAVRTLGSDRQSSIQHMETLVGALRDESGSVRREAVVALGALGKDARTALDVLETMKDDTHCSAEVVAAIQKIKSPP